LDRFDVDVDPERALDFFVDCRASLGNIDSTVAWTVSRVCALGYSIVRRGANSRTAASFLRACIANAFITIASLSNVVHKIQLYIETGMLALFVNSLPQKYSIQADAIVKCCIELLAASQEVTVCEYRQAASSFLAFLLFVPDSPTKAPLYMFNAFLNATARYVWGNECIERGRLFIDCLRYLSAMAQTDLPYRIGYSQCNDAIYGSSVEFMEAIKEKADVVIGQLEELYNQHGDKSITFAIELLETIISIGDIQALGSLVIELYAKCTVRNETRERRRCVRERIAKRATNSAPVQSVYKTICELESRSK
uniref:DUF1981 domain-containing protein n=1 Tax=Toxocara canis TaxID=6265 RepID=A0A183TZ51_TOXCA